eukprot:PhF_6_TR22239/c0_g1_i2/m.31410/K11992/ACOT8, PTE; acyl-CoA thioesterase 8
MNLFRDAIGIECLDRDLYRSKILWTPAGARGTFGGQLIAHCLEAAYLTVPNQCLRPHSMHSNFLAAGLSSQPMYYRVRRLRDGASFATRIVTASQDGQHVFVATVSFQRPEEGGITHQPEMPKVPHPDSLTDKRDAFDDVMNITSVPEKLKENFRRLTHDRNLMTMLYVERGTVQQPLKTSRPQFRWMRSAQFRRTEDTKDAIDHYAVAAFMSDFSLATRPHFVQEPLVHSKRCVEVYRVVQRHQHSQITDVGRGEPGPGTWKNLDPGRCSR